MLGACPKFISGNYLWKQLGGVFTPPMGISKANMGY